MTPPPLLRDYSDDQLKKVAKGEMEIELPKIPCHSQNCERAVAATTFASKKAIGQTKRHEFLLTIQKSRAQIKNHASKKSYFEL